MARAYKGANFLIDLGMRKAIEPLFQAVMLGAVK